MNIEYYKYLSNTATNLLKLRSKIKYLNSLIEFLEVDWVSSDYNIELYPLKDFVINGMIEEINNLDKLLKDIKILNTEINNFKREYNE